MVKIDDISMDEHTGLETLDLSSLNSSKVPEEVHSQINSLCGQIEALVALSNNKEKAFTTASEAIKQETKRVMQKVRAQEEHLLNELWVRHKRDTAHFERKQNQVSDHLQSLIRLIDNACTPSVMEWSLPSSGESTELIGHRVEGLLKDIEKLQAESSSVLVYNSTNDIPKRGMITSCPLSKYKSRIHHTAFIPLRESSLRPPPPLLRQRSHSADELEQDRVDNVHEEQVSGLLASKQFSSMPEFNETETPVPAPRRKRKIHRSLSASTKREFSALTLQRMGSPIHSVIIKPKFLFKLDSIGSEPGQLKQPTDAAMLPNGNIIVCDYNNRRLQEFNLKGQSVQLFNYPRIKPKAVAMTRDNYIAIIDGKDKNIKTYTRGAELVCRFGTGYFNDPCTFNITHKDRYVIIDLHARWKKIVFIYEPMSGIQTWLGFTDSGYLFSNPEGVAITSEDNIMVTDANHHCVFIFDDNGKYLSRFGRQGQGPGEFWYPKGICEDPYGLVMVADSGNHRVCLLDRTGRYLCNVVDSHHGLHFPINICFGYSDDDENILTVVQNAEIHVYHIPRSQAIQSNIETKMLIPSKSSFQSELENKFTKRSNSLLLVNKRASDCNSSSDLEQLQVTSGSERNSAASDIQQVHIRSSSEPTSGSDVENIQSRSEQPMSMSDSDEPHSQVLVVNSTGGRRNINTATTNSETHVGNNETRADSKSHVPSLTNHHQTNISDEQPANSKSNSQPKVNSSQIEASRKKSQTSAHLSSPGRGPQSEAKIQSKISLDGGDKPKVSNNDKQSNSSKKEVTPGTMNHEPSGHAIRTHAKDEGANTNTETTQPRQNESSTKRTKTHPANQNAKNDVQTTSSKTKSTIGTTNNEQSGQAIKTHVQDKGAKTKTESLTKRPKTHPPNQSANNDAKTTSSKTDNEPLGHTIRTHSPNKGAKTKTDPTKVPQNESSVKRPKSHPSNQSAKNEAPKITPQSNNRQVSTTGPVPQTPRPKITLGEMARLRNKSQRPRSVSSASDLRTEPMRSRSASIGSLSRENIPSRSELSFLRRAVHGSESDTDINLLEDGMLI